jgi:phage terminase Nu1 subunit (DNA packaging protein)
MPARPQPPPLPGRSAGIGEYIKSAFTYRWNMLLFLGGVAAAVLSPWPDALIPLVGALEVAYLGGLIASPKFRQAIDAKVYQESREPQPQKHAQQQPGRSLQQVMAGLPPEARRRFEAVRTRCLEMRALAQAARGRTGEPSAADDLSLPALDRLLWVFLRLLVSQEALLRFQKRTDVTDIRTRLADTQKKIEAQKARPDGGDERLIRSLQDSLAAHQVRLDNYERSQKNLEFAGVELDRIEAKIQAIAESSVNRQDPDFLSSQIDSVTETMRTTEKAISELSHITGVVDELQEPPAILSSDFGKVLE